MDGTRSLAGPLAHPQGAVLTKEMVSAEESHGRRGRGPWGDTVDAISVVRGQQDHVRTCHACQLVWPPVSDSEAQEAAEQFEQEQG